MPKQRSGLRWLLLSAFIVAADGVTKWCAWHYLALYQPKAIMPGLNLTLAQNHGAAFSFLSQHGQVATILLSVLALLVVIALCLWLKRLPASQRWLCAGIALVIGGALGNCADRLAFGYVIDFIDVYYKHYHWPTFNVADSAICVGAVIIGLTALRSRQDGE